MSEIEYIQLTYSSSVAKIYTIYLGDMKNLRVFLALELVKSPQFYVDFRTKETNELLDCEHGKNSHANNSFIGQVSSLKSLRIVFEQFAIFDLWPILC